VIIVVTGSRNWDDSNLIRAVLTGIADKARAAGQNPVLIHGNARGVDKMAERIWIELGLPFKRYPADWGRHGKAAGPIRNRQMIDTENPDLVVAFRKGGTDSKGTTDCMTYAQGKGIEVIPWEQ
jgi:hypothetical protein